MRILIFLITCTTIMPTYGADKYGSYTYIGRGSDSCGNVVEAYIDNGLGKLLNSEWANGYLTAINKYAYHGADITDGIDLSSRALWVYKYCQEHPLDKLVDAVSALQIKLQKR